jgi:hypothetical protein
VIDGKLHYSWLQTVERKDTGRLVPGITIG